MSQQSSPDPDPNALRQQHVLFKATEYQIEESVGYLLGRVKAALGLAVEQEIAALDITHSQAICLVMLASGRASNATDLARELCTDMGSLTRLLSRLEKRGLVQRIRSDADRRVVNLQLTDAGRALAARVPEIFTKILNRYFQGFSSEEIVVLKTTLRRILANGN